MCGILVQEKISDSLEDEYRFQHVLESLSHRGPDSTNFDIAKNYYLGFTRLSILDLTSNSNQPYSRYGLTVLFNGEIYNHLALRTKLRSLGFVFQSDGDAEVILLLIYHYGHEQAISMLEGMFSIVISCDHSPILHLVRDRVGIKPLWYSFTDRGALCVSSEVRQLLQLCPTTPNLSVISDFLISGDMYHDLLSFYNNICQFPPGIIASYYPGSKEFTYTSYWQPPSYSPPTSHNYPGPEPLRHLLSQIVNEHFSCDVPVGIALSGGIDSTILAALSNPSSSIHAYSLAGSTGLAEHQLIDQTIHELKHINHTYVETRPFETITTLRSLIWSFSQPFRASQTLYQYALRKVASEQGIRVLLTGDGADEVFGGYTYGIPYYIASLLISYPHEICQEYCTQLAPLTSFTPSELFSYSLLIQRNGICYQSLTTPPIPVNSLQRDIKSYYAPHTLREFSLNRLFLDPVPYWNTVEDLISMSVSIETRLPFLDARLLNAVFSYPDHLHYSHGSNKFLLRLISDDILPDHIKTLPRKYQKPGATPYLIYDCFSSTLLDFLCGPDPLRFIDPNLALNRFSRDLESRNVTNSDFWFRLLGYFLWLDTRNDLSW